MKRIIFHPEAKAEFEDAIRFIKKRRRGWDKFFRDEVVSGMKMIQTTTEGYPRVAEKAARKYSLKRFPYLLIYVEGDQRIELIAVSHTSRRPGYWLERLGDI